MDQTLVKALGVAMLLHLLVGTAAQQMLSKDLLLAAPEQPVPREELPPIAIEFLPPAPSEVLEIEPIAEVPPAPDLASVAPRTRPTKATPKAARVAEAHATGGHPLASEGAAPTSGTASAPAPTGKRGALSMRSGPGMGVPMLNSRLALGSEAQVPAGPGRGQERPDLFSTGVPRGADSSVWRPSGGGTMRATGQPFHAEIKSDGKIEFRDKPNLQIEGVKISETYGIPVLAGRFDVTDAVMASLGETLYPYRKMKLMDESREARSEMAAESKTQDLQQALKNYKKHMRWVWNHPDLSVRMRRKALFLLWDECAETGSEAVVASAKSIRAMTLAFVRKHLPQSSELAYTDEELQEYNRSRRSSAAFSPY